jgi:serine/threonine-protein kinase
LVAVLVVGGAATGGFTYWYENIRIATYTVPSFVGQNEAAIAPLLEEGGWTTDVTQTRVDGTEPGQILEQNPAADTQLEEGGVVALVVSLGPTLVALPPDLVNKTVEEASAALTAAGFVVGEQTPQYSEEVAQGVVLQVGPDLLPEMPKGSTIPLVVSAGPAPRTIPDLGGLTVDQARQRIEALQLNVTTQNRESDAPEGSLLGSNPASGQQVARGSTVTLLVAVPPTVVVPSVAGRTAADAATVLQQAGLQVSGTQGSPANPVRGTDPASGTTVRRGTAVAIITG